MGPGRFTAWTKRSFVTGSAPSDLHDAVRRIAELTRGREAVQQLPAFAAQLLGTSSAHIALISDVQEVQGGVGMAADSIGLLTPSEDSMCSVTVNSRAPTAIEDAPLDLRVAALPPVSSGMVRSYLGVPLEVRGLVVGALCVFDESPRRWTQADVELLQGSLPRSWPSSSSRRWAWSTRGAGAVAARGRRGRGGGLRLVPRARRAALGRTAAGDLRAGGRGVRRHHRGLQRGRAPRRPAAGRRGAARGHRDLWDPHGRVPDRATRRRPAVDQRPRPRARGSVGSRARCWARPRT